MQAFNKSPDPLDPKENLATATFAGGCFWCMEPPFAGLPGVRRVISGYTGGHKDKPTYEEVCSGGTGHLEAVQVLYDPLHLDYEELLDVFWHNIDPAMPHGQFADIGPQYRTAIFYHTPEQKRLAEKSKEELARSGKFSKPIVTAILPAVTFYPAEEDHQGYYKKHPLHYKMYRLGSGREPFLKKFWGEHSE